MEMMPIDRTGVIIKSPRGGSDGWQLRIEDDGAGFLILFSRDFGDRNAEAYDQCAADKVELERKLGGFEISWRTP